MSEENQTLDFEIIDESEIVYSRRVSKKKPASQFDIPLSERTYWGNDGGSDLRLSMGYTFIREGIENGYLIDIDDHPMLRVLNQDCKQELREYQMLALKVMITSKVEDCYLVDIYHDEMLWSLTIDQKRELEIWQYRELCEFVHSHNACAEIFRNVYTNELMFEIVVNK